MPKEDWNKLKHQHTLLQEKYKMLIDKEQSAMQVARIFGVSICTFVLVKQALEEQSAMQVARIFGVSICTFVPVKQALEEQSALLVARIFAVSIFTFVPVKQAHKEQSAMQQRATNEGQRQAAE